MRIDDFRGSSYTVDWPEAEAALSRRYGDDANEFWLSHTDGGFPVLAILVRHDSAALHYFPDNQSAGMQSIGRPSANPSGMTKFFSSSELEELLIPSEAVVPFSDALQAAKEFLSGGAQPRNIAWLVL